MDDENKSVEITQEPKVESRFGFQGKDKGLPKQTVKILMVGAALSLGTIMWMRAPDKPDISSSGVDTPETSQVGAIQAVSLETYSAQAEKDQITEKNRKSSKRTLVVKLPGLQKIDRTRANQIPPGSEVRARLLTGASNGLVRAVLLESLRVQGENYLKAGETVVGQGQSTEDRLFVRFTQVVHKDGSVEAVQGQAVDAEDKTAGLPGSKFKRYAMRYGTAVGLYFVGGMTEGLQERTIVGQQVVANPDAKNALLNGASRAAVEMANDQMSNMRNQPPPISIPAGQEILIVFETAQ
jgi:hypothetical protein